MGVNEDDVMNIMGGMEHAGGIKLNDHKRKLKNRFEISRKLGQGTYGKVQLGINKETGQQVAIKTIKKSKIETEADLIRIRREIQIMSSVQHPNIIHIYEVFENKEKMVLVMEIAAGGELYDYLSERKCLEENEARRIFRQIATAVYYCHKNNICHRDLKLENILLDENGNAKIADFGLSNVYDGKNLLNTFCGSPLYASPEIVRGSPYAGPEVDCWSLGVLLYTLVYGAMPFDGSNFKRLVKQITNGDYYEPKHPSSASNLIRTMLTVSSEKRANIGDICSHWWVNDGYGQTCLEEAEYLASLTPVRLDLLLSLARSEKEDAEQVRATPSLPQEEAMSIVELPSNEPIETVEEPSEAANKKSDMKNKRKLTETPSMVDPDLVSKKPSAPVVDMEVSDSAPATPAPAPPPTATPKSGRATPKVHKKRKEGSETPVNDLVPEMTPEIQRKPPSSKAKHSDQEGPDPQSHQAKMKRRVSRKERARDVKTPDPTFGPSPVPDEDGFRPMERPSTPRQARAPSPEDRPLVVPLPPPRIQDPSPVRKPVQAELAPPALPPRPSSATPKSQEVNHSSQPQQQQQQQPQLPPPPPPPRLPQVEKELPPAPPTPSIDEDKLRQRILEDMKVFKQLESTIPAHKVQVETLDQPEDVAEPLIMKDLPSLAQAKEAFRNSGLFTCSTDVEMAQPVTAVMPEKKQSAQAQSVAVNKAFEPTSSETQPQPTPPKPLPPKPNMAAVASSSISRQEQEEDMRMEEAVPNKNVNNNNNNQKDVVQQIVSPRQIEVTASKSIASESVVPMHQNKNKLGEQVTSPGTLPSSNNTEIVAMRQSNIKRNEEIPQQVSSSLKTEAGAIHVQELKTVPDNTTVATATNVAATTMTQAASQQQNNPASISTAVDEKLKDKPNNECNETGMNNNANAATADQQNDESSRSLINSLPKPFKANIPPENSTEKETKMQLEVLASEAVSASNSTGEVTKIKEQSRENEKAKDEPMSSSSKLDVQELAEAPDTRSSSGIALNSNSHSPSPALQNSQSGSSQNHSPQPNLLHLLHRPEKRDNRDSKVFKAASYWNSYIDEVKEKKKPPDNVKSLEKPKKITSAGVGPRGMENLKSAFESNNKLNQKPEEQVPASVAPMQRRNSRKITPVEGCTPGLKVNDAKSVFEKNSQQSPTPVLYRRNSSMTGDSTVKLNVTKGKESGNDSSADQLPADQQSNGPTYVRKKVPEFPPPSTTSSTSTTKTPFGAATAAASRRQGALSPRTVQMNAVEEGKLSISPFESTELVKMNNNQQQKSQQQDQQQQQQQQPVQRLSGPPTVQPNAEVSNKSKPESKLIQKLKVSVQANQQQTPETNSSAKSVNGHSERTSNSAKAMSNNDDGNVKTVSNNDSKPTNNVPSGPVLTIKSISREEGVVATMSPTEEKKPSSKNDASTKPVNNQVPVRSDQVKQVEIQQEQQPKLLKPEHIPNEVNPTEVAPAVGKQTVAKEKSPRMAKKELREKSKGEPISVKVDHLVEKPQNAAFNEPTKKGQLPQQQPTSPSSYRSIKIEKEVEHQKQPSVQQHLGEVKVSTTVLEKPVDVEAVSVASSSSTSRDINNSQNKPAPLRIIPIQIEQTNNINVPVETSPVAALPTSTVATPTPTSASTAAFSEDGKVSSRLEEHHIPIHVEGKGTIVNNLAQSSTNTALEDLAETRDSFSTNSLSRRRFGSRKKRISSAYSDSSMSAEDDAASAYGAAAAFSGLQKYTSIGKGKHGMEPMFKLRKTRPPFATQRSDSFSSGEEDDFDDDGFREMTADNLFSTLLTRVKSLTRRIHDDHEDQLSRASSSFHQNHGIINHRLNPGNTHARLERTALRNSLKRNNSNTPVTAASLSRQSSMDTSMRTSLRDYDGVSSTLAGYDDGTSSIRSYSSFGGTGSDALGGGGSRTSATSSTINQQRGISTNDTNNIQLESGGVNQQQQQLQQNQGKEESKRYIDLEIGNSTTTTTMSAAPSSGSKSTDQQQPLSSSSSNDPSNLQSNVSVTSKQRLRPGYLPPPSHLASDQSATDSTSHDTRIEHALSQSSSLNKHLDRMPMPLQQQQSSTTASSSSNTASVTSVMTSVSKPSTSSSTTRQIPINVEQSSNSNADSSKNVVQTSVANVTKPTTIQNDDVMETLSQKSGYSNRSSARPTSSAMQQSVVPPQKEPRRQSRYLQQDAEDSNVPLTTKPYLQIGKPMVGSSSSSVKRLSGNFDLDQDNDNSSSSGYYSSQPHHQQQQRQQHHPIQQHRQNPPTSTRSLEGSRTSNQSMKNSSNFGRKGTAMDHYRKISSETQMAESDILNRLRREAAERANDLASELSDGYLSPLDPEFFGSDSDSVFNDKQRKRSLNMSRVDEYQRPSGAGMIQRSLSRGESYDSEPNRNPGRHVTRRSISRELYNDFATPSWAPTTSSSGVGDYSRNSRERSLGKELNFDSISSRRSESLSRPSLASHGRSLTQSELGSSSSTRRYSSGLRSPITVQEDLDVSKYNPSRYVSSLDDKSRSDWRRVSVPERGKDFKSLSKKYNRYSNIIEDQPCYLATTSVSSRVDPDFFSSSRTVRSNSQNRILSPTFNSSASLKDFRKRDTNLPSSGSSGSLRLDNFVTLQRRPRRSEYVQQAPLSPGYRSPSQSPMVLSPSATRQFYVPSSSREGSVTPKPFSHSCSNASIVSEKSAAD